MSGNVYRYLDTLITAGSFSKAARVLQISQPSISQFVHRLETEVGTQLVDRTAKPLRLTYAGECFMKTEREIEQLRSMRSRLIADIGEGVRGHVTMVRHTIALRSFWRRSCRSSDVSIRVSLCLWPRVRPRSSKISLLTG